MSSFKAGKTVDTPEAGKKKTLSNGGGNGKMGAGESAGVKFGLSERSALNVDAGEPEYDTQRNKLTGNATERRKPRSYETVAGGFQIEN